MVEVGCFQEVYSLYEFEGVECDAIEFKTAAALVEKAATYKDGLKAEQSVDGTAVKTEQGVDEFTAFIAAELLIKRR